MRRIACPRRPPIRQAVAFALMLFGELAPAADTVETDRLPELLERYAAADHIPGEYRPVLRGDGVVFVGRIETPPGLTVATRTPIRSDGSFATAVYPGRRLLFYAHGHEPLEVSRGTEIFPRLFDVGDLRFTPTPPQRLRKARGRTRLGDNPPASRAPRIHATLGITNLAYLWRDHGHRGAHVTVDVRTLSLRPGESYAFDGLSPVPYHIRFSADGYITRRIKLPPDKAGAIASEDVVLDPAPVLTFTYLSQIDLAAPETWKPGEAQSQTITCDGDSRFLYAAARDGLGNQFYLRLKPGQGQVEATFWARPCEFYELGRGKLTDYAASPSWISRLSEQKPSAQQTLTRGRVYFFRNVERATTCLFAVD